MFALLFYLVKIGVDEKISQVANSDAGIVLERPDSLVRYAPFQFGIGGVFL